MRIGSFICASLAVVLGSAATSGCHSDVDERLALAGLSAACRINSDCSAQLVCVFERCHQECATSRDCDDGARCVQGEQRRDVCQLPDERACDVRDSCPGLQVCGVDAECRDACSSDSVCIAEQICSSGTCADESELDDQGLLPATSERPATAPCVFDSDCPDSLLCRAGACRVECATAADCRSGQSCSDGVCKLPAASTPECLRSSDCAAQQHCARGVCRDDVEVPEPECAYDSECVVAGQRCLDGLCACECATDSDCSAGRSCSAGCACVPSRVISGDFVVTNDAELRELDDVVEVTGELRLAIASTGEFHVRQLRKLGSLRTTGNGSFVLDSLEEVKGSFDCSRDCRAPLLNTAGQLRLNTANAVTIEFQSLTFAQEISVSSNLVLTSVAFPKLAEVTNFFVQGNAQLRSVAAPLLVTIESIALGYNEQLSIVHLPLAAPSVGLNISTCPALTSLSFPSAVSVGTMLSIQGAPLLTTLDVPGLRHAEAFWLNELPKLIGLELPSLQSIGTLKLTATGLTELGAFPPSALAMASTVQLVSNAALSVCAARGLDPIRSNPDWTGQFLQANNQACDCGGVECCVAATCNCGGVCE